MTDITKLLDEHPLPWAQWHPWMNMPDVVVDARGKSVRLTPDIVLALANALHAERQKNAAPAKRFEPPLNDSGDVDALRYRIEDLERIVRDGERLEAIEARLDAIANAARGSDE